jgi:hypothetical protein
MEGGKEVTHLKYEWLAQKSCEFRLRVIEADYLSRWFVFEMLYFVGFHFEVQSGTWCGQSFMEKCSEKVHPSISLNDLKSINCHSFIISSNQICPCTVLSRWLIFVMIGPFHLASRKHSRRHENGLQSWSFTIVRWILTRVVVDTSSNTISGLLEIFITPWGHEPLWVMTKSSKDSSSKYIRNHASRLW